MIIRVRASEDPELMACVVDLSNAANGHSCTDVLSASVGLACLTAKEEMDMSLDQLLDMVRVSWTGVPSVGSN